MDFLYVLSEQTWPSDPFYGSTTLNIGDLAGGVSGYVVPAYAYADVVVQSAVPVAEIKESIMALPAQNLTITWLSEVDPFKCDTVPGFDVQVFNFGSDIALYPGDHRSYIFGPGSILNAHTDVEHISKENLLSGINRIQALVVDILAQQR